MDYKELHFTLWINGIREATNKYWDGETTSVANDLPSAAGGVVRFHHLDALLPHELLVSSMPVYESVHTTGHKRQLR